MIEPVPGVAFDPKLISPELVAGLRDDQISRFKIIEKTRGVQPLPRDENWLVVDASYPAQMQKRLELLQNFQNDHQWLRARLPGNKVRRAEIELREKVVDYLTATYPLYFERKGACVTSPLTGITVDISKKTDPRVAMMMLASEDLLLMCPDGKKEGITQYKLKSGVLAFPNGWSLVSKIHQPEQADIANVWHEAKKESLRNARLGKTPAEIHKDLVPHYDKHFAHHIDLAFSNMQPGKITWRRNWGPTLTDELFQHFDSKQPNIPATSPEVWNGGFVRSEHETFRKLEQSGAIVFSIKTLMLPIQNILKNNTAKDCLFAAFKHMEANEPDMWAYRKHYLPSFGRFLHEHAGMAG